MKLQSGGNSMESHFTEQADGPPRTVLQASTWCVITTPKRCHQENHGKSVKKGRQNGSKHVKTHRARSSRWWWLSWHDPSLWTFSGWGGGQKFQMAMDDVAQNDQEEVIELMYRDLNPEDALGWWRVITRKPPVWNQSLDPYCLYIYINIYIYIWYYKNILV